MSQFTSIDLSRLPKPLVIEELDFEAILQSRKTKLIGLLNDVDADVGAKVSAVLELESEPLTKLLEEDSYRELLLRQRINDAAHSTMLAFAAGADLDHIGDNPLYRVERLIITPADETSTPPTPAVYESDDRFRQRIQLAPEGYTTAGSVGSYIYHILSSSPKVKDVNVSSSTPGVVDIVVLSTDNLGFATEELKQEVYHACNADKVRPLTDSINVLSAEIIEYNIKAKLYFYGDLDTQIIIEEATRRVELFVKEHHRLGHNIHQSAIHAALTVQGVQRVELEQPQDIIVPSHSAAFCQQIEISKGGIDV